MIDQPVLTGNSISLQTALLGAVTSNPDLVTLRNSNLASPEAVEVARNFPTTLNPTLWVDFRPITLIPQSPFGSSNGGTGNGTGSSATRMLLTIISARSGGTSRFASRSNWDTRPATGTRSPRRRGVSSSGM